MAVGAPNVASVGLRVFPDMTGFRTKLVFGLQTPLLQTAKFGIAAFAGLGAALGSVGVLGAKAFYDVEQSMAKVVGLVGIAKEEVVIMTEALGDMARVTTQSPGDLAEALFFITSAGIRDTADALDVLELSAKAATAGLGETKVVADAVTSAVNAYGIANLSAAEATDILVATVREGKVQADSVAQSLGRVIPVAAELGVSFDQVGATIAALTRLGLDASESTTALRAILFALIRPARGAEKELAKVGLSSKQLRANLRGGESVIDLLLKLKAAFEGNEEALAKVFPRVRGLTGVLNLVGNNAEQAEGIFMRMTDTTGDLDDAFAAVAETSGFVFNQAIAEMQAVLMEVGQRTLPAFAGVLRDLKPSLTGIGTAVVTVTQAFGDFVIGVGKIIQWFVNLPGPIRATAAAVGLLAAALTLLRTHPIVAALSIVVGAIALVGKESRESEEAVRNLKAELEASGDLSYKSLQGLLSPRQIELMRKYGVTLNDMKKAIETGNLPKIFSDLASGLDDYNAALNAQDLETSQEMMAALTDSGFSREDAAAMGDLAAMWTFLGGAYSEAQKQITEARTADIEERRNQNATEQMYRDLAAANDLDAAIFGLGETSGTAAGGIDGLGSSLDDLEQDAIDAAEAFDDLVEAQLKAADPAFGLFSAIGDLEDARAAINDPKAKPEDMPQLLLEGLEAQAEYDAALTRFLASQDTSIGRLTELYSEFGEALPEEWQGIIETLTTVPELSTTDWQTIGEGVKEGIIDGVDGLAEALRDKAAAELRRARHMLAHVEAISSPSKVWAEAIGKPIAQGIALGISGGAREISSAASAAIGVPPRVGGGYGGGTHITVVKPNEFDLASATNDALEKARTVDLSRRVLR